MNRREWLTLIAGWPLIRVTAKPFRYGHMTVERWHADGHYGKRVLCGGVDITDRCTEFDDTADYAVVFRHHPPLINNDEIIQDRLQGRIEVRS